MIMVITVLLMSAALLNATRRQMEDALSLLVGEQAYYQQSSQAISALNWGEQQPWSEQTGWQCKTLNATGWRACLLQRRQSPSLLRADSGNGTIAFWQWMTRSTAGYLKKVPHGWLDFCPLTDEKLCQPDE
ncbi:DUF2509 family protein [Erwinia psidii]|uniref:DUF2509 family protein n=2 Tax=Erwinia psidii TaxID=69224 RepID=A0A3N6S3K3_9GAMM|nr:DUF2509 family protein [Erwinia psidii]MCX8956875.1 DUF2509 family protein [Erwinia psidii]MCX8960314.1 DUF2509 family protein [Erwinia psidii]MCX8964506.1 DUF2509 family protein [Erwinia psidii]RQM40194.1 DUF2509 family protein [Erwinia psidii]